MSTLDIKKGDLFRHPKGLIRFEEWDNHNVMVFRPLKGGKEVRIPEHEFSEQHGRREIRGIEQDAQGNPLQLREFGPGECWTDTDDPKDAKLTEEGRRALAFQFYTKKWDLEGTGSLGDKGLQKLIDRHRSEAIGKEFEPKEGVHGFRVQVARLRNCIKKCGRPCERPLAAFRSLRGKGAGRCFDEQIENALLQAIDYFYGKRGRDHNDAYCEFRDRVKAINAKRAADDQLPLPRPDVVRRRINKAANEDNWTRKYSKQEAWKKFHGRRAHISAKRPLELAIVDATPLDGFVVLDSSTYLPLGRPHLTACLDRATRMTLGYVATFEPPSLYSVSLTMQRAHKNKRYVQKLYPQITRPWDGWGCPAEILLDRDWSHQAPSFQHSMAGIGTDVHWAPSRNPQYKAVGERFFRTANDWFIHKLPGAVRYNSYVARQVGLDPQADAIITLEDFDELMHEFNDSYIYSKHDGIGAVPARVWQEGLLIQRRRFIKDVAAIDHMIGRTDAARISPKGIQFRNMRFHDEAATTTILEDVVRFEQKRSQSALTYAPARARVVVKWNPADAGGISVWNHGAEIPYYVRLPNVSSDFTAGMSFWHYDRLREFAEQKDLEFSTEEQRWDARNLLRKHWEKLAADMPMRESRQARRGLASALGQFDDYTRNETVELTQDDIVDVEVEASTAGLNRPDGVSDEIVAALLEDKEPPKGRTPSKTTVAKIKRTKARKKAEKAEAEHAAYVKEQRGDPTGDPHARSAPVEDDEGGDEGWGESVEATSTAPESESDDEFTDSEGW
jgi:putative transposase